MRLDPFQVERRLDQVDESFESCGKSSFGGPCVRPVYL